MAGMDDVGNAAEWRPGMKTIEAWAVQHAEGRRLDREISRALGGLRYVG